MALAAVFAASSAQAQIRTFTSGTQIGATVTNNGLSAAKPLSVYNTYEEGSTTSAEARSLVYR